MSFWFKDFLQGFIDLAIEMEDEKKASIEPNERFIVVQESVISFHVK